MNSRPTYEWKISSSTPYIDDILLSGYYRQHLNANIICGIRDTIRSLVGSQYNTSGLPFGEYTISDVKNRRKKPFTFISPMFVADSLKFYLTLLPIYRPSRDVWQFLIQIHLCDRPSEINCYFTICLKEMHVESNLTFTFYRYDKHGAKVVFNNISTDDVNNLNELSIQLFKQHATARNVIAKSIGLPSIQYSRYIDHQHWSKPLWSKPFLFGEFRCYFALDQGSSGPYSNFVDVSLNLYSLPTYLDKISVRSKVIFIKCGEMFVNSEFSTIEFTHSQLRKSIANIAITNKSPLTIFLDITICEGYVSGLNESFDIVPNYMEQFALSNPQMTPLRPSQYVWHVPDIDYNVPKMFGITSNIFTAKLFKWYLTMYPNGINEKTDGQLCISLTLAIQTGKTVDALCTVRVMEIGFKWEQVIHCDKEIIIIVGKSSRIANETSLSVHVAFELLTINGVVNDMHYKCSDIVTKSQQYIWKINKRYLHLSPSNATMILQSKIFEMYSMRWYLSVYPKSVVNKNTPSVALTLECLPSNVTALYTRCVFTIDKPKRRYIMNGVFDKRKKFIAWGKDMISVDQLDACVIQIDMELLDVYNGNLNVTNDFMPDHYDMVDFELKSWFDEKVQLPQYYQVFVENGIDKLSILKLVTINELNEMKITKIGHRIKILHEIEKLNSSNIT
eukprot:917031_1